MSKTYRRRYQEDDLIQPGERHRVQMFNMDALDTEQLTDAERRVIDLTKKKLAADAEHQVTDGLGNTGMHLRRPGARFAADATALDAVQEARREYLDTLTNAWRGDAWSKSKPSKDDDEETGGRRRRSQFRDPAGREQGTEEEEFDDRLRRQQSARRQATDAAYAAVEAEQRDAYRNGK
jgi:hypothetical protein